MKKVVKTLVFLIDDEKKKILLGMKKARFGAGRWNGYGGKVDPGESIEQAAVRELEEESSVESDIQDLVKHAVILFYSPNFDTNEVHIYRLKKWRGEAVETEEMRPQWYSFGAIPYDNMWADDAHWLPKVLNNEIFEGQFWFDKDDKIEKFELKPAK
jgi:ADP-ribose pyrophosphatase YjhB (NUDIX family)